MASAWLSLHTVPSIALSTSVSHSSVSCPEDCYNNDKCTQNNTLGVDIATGIIRYYNLSPDTLFHK